MVFDRLVWKTSDNDLLVPFLGVAGFALIVLLG